MLQSVSSPYIQSLLEFDFTKTDIRLVSELAKTDLEKFLGNRPNQPVPVKQFRLFAQQMVAALKALECGEIVHYDIKPSNILLYRFDCRLAKLADFGLAKWEGDSLDFEGLRGTPIYMAPEILTKVEIPSAKSDLWGMGLGSKTCFAK